MRNNLIFNGVDFGSAFSAYIANSNFLDGAAKDVTSIEIVGRSGNLEIFNGRYKNISLSVQMYVLDNMKDNMDAMRKFLAASIGYCRYEESMNPQEFRMASFKQAFAPGLTDASGGVVTLEFDAKPQRYLQTGEEWQSISSGGTIENPTLYASKPIIRIAGNGTVNIGNIYITVAEHSYPYIDIDCEQMNAFYEASNANSLVSFSTTDVITLPSGTINITYDVSSVQIMPRWYQL